MDVIKRGTGRKARLLGHTGQILRIWPARPGRPTKCVIP